MAIKQEDFDQFKKDMLEIVKKQSDDMVAFKNEIVEFVKKPAEGKKPEIKSSPEISTPDPMECSIIIASVNEDIEDGEAQRRANITRDYLRDFMEEHDIIQIVARRVLKITPEQNGQPQG